MKKIEMNFNFKEYILKQIDFWLLMIILFLMPIAGMFTVAGKPVQISDLLFLIYFMVWLIKRIILKKIQVNIKFYLFCSLFIVLCFSTYFSPFPERSVIGLIIKIYLLSLAYVISEEINSPFKLKWSLNIILISGFYVIILSFWGIIKFKSGFDNIFIISDLYFPFPFLPRLQSTFSSPNFLSSFLIIILMILGGRLLFINFSFKESLSYKIFFMVAIIVFILTFSRDFIGFGWGLVFLLRYLDMNQNKRRIILIILSNVMFLATIFILVISIWYVFPIKVYRNSNGLLPSKEIQYNLGEGILTAQMGFVSEKHISFNSHLNNRSMLLRDAWQTFLQYPIVGIGVGVLPSKGYSTQPYSLSSHNTYLQILSQTGILGFIIFYVFVISLFRILGNIEQNNKLYSIKITFQSVLIAFLFIMLFTDLDNFRYFWILAGLILSLENFNLSKQVQIK